MIIARSPLRTTLGGGGTDLPSYYRDHGGLLIAAAIDKYVYVTLNRPFAPGIHLQYSENELVATIDEIRHPIMRETLRLFEADRPQIEISTFADVPWGTGLGSSGSFTTALLFALHAERGTTIPPADLAEQACHIEIDLLGASIGKQDQYIAALGGLTCFSFNKDGTVTTEPLMIEKEARAALEARLLFFFTGHSRSASDILSGQNRLLKDRDQTMVDRFHYEKENARQSKAALERGDLQTFGSLLHDHWVNKRKRLAAISSPQLDHWYEVGIEHGALGGKLVGAGGGGFLMFLADDASKLRKAMQKEGLTEMLCRFENGGTRTVTI